jgi:formylglycine-generating enzyme required for sulfatase activity
MMMRQILVPLISLAAASAFLAAVLWWQLPPSQDVDRGAAATAHSTSASEQSDDPGRSDRASELPPPSANPRTGSMVWIPAGEFVMGAEQTLPDEFPPHTVRLDGFWMDPTEVTNRQFDEFVRATGYVTIAEKPPTLSGIQPGSALENATILPEFNKPGSICSMTLRSRQEIDPSKGAYSPERAGAIPKVPTPTSPNGWTTPWFTLAGRMPSRIASGPEPNCRPKHSGNTPRAVDETA